MQLEAVLKFLQSARCGFLARSADSLRAEREALYFVGCVRLSSKQLLSDSSGSADPFKYHYIV
jgi:hypothetical protein